MDSLEKFQETHLPPIEKCYSSLNNENASEEEYQNAVEIWCKLQIRNKRNFTNLYNKVDILLFVGIVENFRDISL